MSKKLRPFKQVQGNHPGRSVFDLSYSKLMTMDMGFLYPIMCDEVIPGDKWKIGNEIVVRFQPLVSPVLHEIKCYVHYFFVPYRILWDQWEDFITGGVDGDDASSIPKWNGVEINIGSLWDTFGLPTGDGQYTFKPDANSQLPLDFLRRAYNKVWDNFYRNENFQDEISSDTVVGHESLLRRNWSKDYFTTLLPWQQRGTPPALPISGSIPVNATTVATVSPIPGLGGSANTPYTDINLINDVTFKAWLNGLGFTGDLSGAVSSNVSDLRLMIQLQRFQELNARGGIRYVEWLHAHYGVSPRDDRLQRPEYIGGTVSPVVFSEVLQTSNNTNDNAPQGNMAGHGINVSSGFAGTYYAQEFGLILGLMSVVPVPMYQQGTNRQWLRNTRFDFPNPAWYHLSEQAVTRQEIFTVASESTNAHVLGYQGRFDELRTKQNQVTGLMRTAFSFWHLGRIFASAPDIDDPYFLPCAPDTRIFAVENVPGMIVHFGNKITAIRPIPFMGSPGLMDHV